MAQAQSVRVVMFKNASLVNLHTALDKMRTGSDLTAGDTGVSAEAGLSGLSMAYPPLFEWDGASYVLLYFLTG